MDRPEFEAQIENAPSEQDRIAWFGALLGRESRLATSLVIVGGSAIEIYLTSRRYVSDDIDIVGSKRSLIPVLRRWGFAETEGRDHRVYWKKEGLGLVDLVGTAKRSGLPPRRYRTPFGDVLLGPVEDLILRRLMRASREKSEILFRQAEALAVEHKRGLDWQYMKAEARYEGVAELLEALRQGTSRLR